MIYLELFYAFLKVGCFAFGGAYAAIPLIRDTVLSYGWLDDEKLSYLIAVSESTPGPIMVNLATYVGNTKGGIIGAALATLGVILPAFMIIIIIMLVMKNIMEKRCVKAVIDGLNASVIGIIAATGIYMLLKGCFSFDGAFSYDKKAVLTAVILFAVRELYRLIGKKKISPKAVGTIAVLSVVAVVCFAGAFFL